MTIGKGYKRIRLEKVKDALTQQIRHNADVVPKVKTVSKVDALVPILLVVGRERRQHSQLDPGGVAVLLHGPDDLDGTFGPLPSIVRLHHLAKGALTKETADFVYKDVSGSEPNAGVAREDLHRSVKVVSGRTI